jgi:hypothetical protein
MREAEAQLRRGRRIEDVGKTSTWAIRTLLLENLQNLQPVCFAQHNIQKWASALKAFLFDCGKIRP